MSASFFLRRDDGLGHQRRKLNKVSQPERLTDGRPTFSTALSMPTPSPPLRRHGRWLFRYGSRPHVTVAGGLDLLELVLGGVSRTRAAEEINTKPLTS
jgi:hypothetical protein